MSEDYTFVPGVVSVDEFDALLNEPQIQGRAPVYGKAQYDLGFTWFEKGHNSGADDVFVPCGASKESREAAVKRAVEVALSKGISVTKEDGKTKAPQFAIRVKLFKDYSYKNLGDGFAPVTWSQDSVHVYPNWKNHPRGEAYKMVTESLKAKFTNGVPLGVPVVVETEFVPDLNQKDANGKAQLIETVAQVFTSFEAMVETLNITATAVPDSELPGYTDAVKELGYDAGTWRDMSSQFRAQKAAGKSAEQIASEYELPLDAVQAVLA